MDTEPFTPVNLPEHYRVEAEIGRGGMGTVYERAIGTRLLENVRDCDRAFSAVEDGNLLAADSIFTGALRRDPRYGRAALWLAMTRTWFVSTPVEVRSLVATALSDSSRLTRREFQLARALSNLESRQYADACAIYRTIIGAAVALAVGVAALALVARPSLRQTLSSKPHLQTTPIVTADADEIVVDTLAPHATDVWPLRLTGWSHTRIAVHAPPRAVECGLLDPDGRPLRLPRAFGDPCRFAWVPARTGAYRIEIRNLRNAPTPYSVVTNRAGRDQAI